MNGFPHQILETDHFFNCKEDNFQTDLKIQANYK